ncbi:MAG: RNA 2',3'-cyclic phosphodiesterase [Clostridia bacterium]|nr:RNA 2',3'-cyclic phosphodiesterase [Clostridia bacterium]
MRIFIALEIPQRTKDNLARSAGQFKQFATNGTFVSTQNYHITLHFLGEVAESDLMYVQHAMDGVRNLPAPTLALLQFVTLRGSDATVARLKNSPTLTELHDILGEKLEHNGFTVEHRAYRPHITICRKGKFTLPFAEVTKNVDVFNAPFVATKVVLYQSVLSKEGPTYTPLYTVTLPEE